MKALFSLLCFAAVPIILSGCTAAIMAGSLYIEEVQTNYADFRETASDVLEGYADTLKSGRSEDVVTCNTDRYNLFTEDRRTAFYAALLVYNDLALSADGALEIAPETIEEFITLFFEHSVYTYTKTDTYEEYYEGEDGEVVEAIREETTSYAVITISARRDLYEHLSFSEEQITGAGYLQDILSEILASEEDDL